MPSAIRLLALMGRENNPLYVRSFDPTLSTEDDQKTDLRYHFLAHIALDVFAARLPTKSADSDFGLLFVQDGIAIYGWMTNTGVKIILGFSSGEVIGSEIRSIFRAIHFAYISLVCNAFYDVDERQPITSRKFDISVRRIVEAWNGTTPPAARSVSVLPGSPKPATPVENVVMSYSDSRTATPVAQTTVS
ncbi:Sedlin, N-terminal conserved region-domain-containing protein [Kockiozyma suomiensis]|uniref:Sedlin, N-terminal conserved region-domain-containing protein n=1 Tax=Kockiozyma suomiensis TaxID=1337062 RepID=UPI0033433CAB